MDRRYRTPLFALVSLLMLGGCADPGADTADADAAPIACEPDLVESIDMDRTLGHIRVLADEIGPRVASSRAEREAAEYIARELEGYGYEVEIQEFPRDQVVSRIEVLEPVNLRVHPATGRIDDTPASEYFQLTGEEGITAEVVDCGEGACPAEAEGAIALFAQGDSDAGELLAHAAEVGAVAAILHGDDWRRHLTSVEADDAVLPFVTVNVEAGEALRDAGGARVTLHVEFFDTSQNVIATRRVEGDPDAPVVIFSAHYDSVEQAPGANDNASGTAGMIELARLYATVETDVELRFAAVGAEEVGLVGSRYYVSQLPDHEIERVAANFNTDMIGTAGELQTQLFVNTLDGDNVVARSARVARDRLELPEERMRAPFERGASDHVAFHEAGIPAANFIWRDPETIDLEPWYHHPHDTPDRISADRLSTAMSVVLLAAQQVICEAGAFRDEVPAALER